MSLLDNASFEESKIDHPKTTVVNMRHCKDANVFPVDRTTALGNPFRIGKDGTRDEVIAKYKIYFKKKMETDEQFQQYVYSLVGCKLGCWCAPLPCHAQVIADFLNEGK